VKRASWGQTEGVGDKEQKVYPLETEEDVNLGCTEFKVMCIL
jgi:hypothetical protein